MSQFDHQSHWSARYASVGDDYLFGTAPNRFLARQAGLFSPGMKVLSVADGEGRNSVWLAERGLDVTAAEISPVAIDKARRLATERGVVVDFTLTDVLAWDWPEERFDAIVAIFIQFATPPERAHLFAGIQRALKPGGVLLLEGYAPKQLDYRTGGPSAVENLYTAELLRQSFAALDIVELREYEDVLDEGSAHSGRSALVDLIARRPG